MGLEIDKHCNNLPRIEFEAINQGIGNVYVYYQAIYE